tara:strand:- start:404 stop:778 length:375 start_codon:yes stop_codon:yes gene_type:complete
MEAPALTLSERLAVVRENANLSPISDSTVPATLRTFLAIYHKARCACYVDYMEGAQVLHDWLTSKGAVPLDHTYAPTPRKPPNLCISYDMLKLGEIVGITHEATDTCKAVARIFAEVYHNEYIR